MNDLRKLGDDYKNSKLLEYVHIRCCEIAWKRMCVYFTPTQSVEEG